MTDKPLSGRRILVVEDEMMIMIMIEDMLADLGCQSVSSAATVNQALALIEGQSFDAAMLDMNLGGENSEAVADVLAARGVPFAFSTGYSTRDMKLGQRDRPILRKPFSYEALAEVVTGLLVD